MASTYRISLQDFITEISYCIGEAAKRLETDENAREASTAALALIRVHVRFSAKMEHRQRWFHPRHQTGEIHLNFHKREQANFSGELYFSGNGELLEPITAGQEGAGSLWG